MKSNQHSVPSFFDNLFGIEAIDKFVAKEFGFIDELEQEEQFIWAGLLAYLSYMQRNGHSCIYLKDIASTTLFKEVAAEQEAALAVETNEHSSNGAAAASLTLVEQTEQEKAPKAGVDVPQLTPLLRILKSALVNEQVAQLFVYSNGKLYSRRYYEFEQEVARNVVKRAALTPLSDEASEKVKQLWPAIFPTETTDRQDWQQIAVAKSLMQRFCVINGGPGTGKTYTGVALAVKALKNKQVKRIILTRPAVEAGENLGFLPGDLKEKLDPYMQPLYGALRDMIPAEKLEHYIENGIIQIAPMAFMRGRTLDDAFVILDEAQNTTHNQMKMFLTRMGKNAKFMITGDPGQIDLPRRVISGLKEAILVLGSLKGIGMIYLDDKDVIRHRLVKQVIEAYKQTEHHN